MDKILILPIIIPLFCGILIFFTPKRLSTVLAFLATLATLLLTATLFKNNLSFSVAWIGPLEFGLRLYHFSAFIILASSSFGFLIALYSIAFMKDKNAVRQFYAYLLISVAFVNGAVLADNLLAMLFFWEGILLTVFGMIAIGNKGAFRTATKAFIIVGISDLCMMFGIIITGLLSGTLTISKINLPLDSMGGIAFVFLMIGAISKAGSMPFHTWIPDAAIDAPLPFMAMLPAALEKLLGIYFLTRISLDMFILKPDSWISFTLMTIGSLTIILAVMMALIQKDYKRLLSYHAISQVGYMILGIGTAVPAGIIGGLFHMINNAMYKSCLFLTGGAVEKQTGTTDLEKLGGIGSKMPITFACFIVTAVSISGVPPFNGFFSKELVYDGALQRGLVFYILAVAGSFFTAASFLKLGHSAFLGKLNEENKDTKEASFVMLIPMIIISLGCIVFGVYNYLPINTLISPILGPDRVQGHNFAGMPANTILIIISVVILIGAFLNHLFGLKLNKSAIKAVDHIHYAPVLSQIYDKAERRLFDPYEIGLDIANMVSRITWWFDRKIDWLYDNVSVDLTYAFSNIIRRLHTGNYSVYLAWSLTGMLFVTIFLMYSG